MSRKKNHVKFKKKKTVILRTTQKIKRKKDLKKKESRHCSQKVKIIIIINNALKGANAHKSRQKKKKGKKNDNGTKLVQWAILSFNHKTPPHYFLFILERQVLGGPGWKMPGPHQKVSSSSLLTKQHPFSFSLLFSLQTFPSSLKSTHPNIVLMIKLLLLHIN